MSQYNHVIARDNVEARIPETVAAEVQQTVVESSAALQLFKSVPLSSRIQRIPVLSVLPVAYFVDGDTGLKKTTEMAWDKRYLSVEEIATIVPVPDAVLDDTDFDVWGEVRPRLAEAIGRALDAAIFFGINKPASWPDDITTAAEAAGNQVTEGTNNAAAGGIAGDISDVMSLLEDDGYDVNGFYTRRNFRGKLRKARDTTGQKLLDVGDNTIEGVTLTYGMPGLWPSGSGAVELFAGDWAQGMIGTRQDLTFKILDQAVITDDSGAVIFNLPQQDMVALRVVARYAFQVPNPVNFDNVDSSTRYPFAVLKHA